MFNQSKEGIILHAYFFDQGAKNVVALPHFCTGKDNAGNPYRNKNLFQDGIFQSELCNHRCLGRNEFLLLIQVDS